MYKRFGWAVWPKIDNELWTRMPTKPSKIFVCSTFEIFHPMVEKEHRDWIFNRIEKHPQHTFQILTKMPENIDRPMPDNVWLGVSVTKLKDIWRAKELYFNHAARIKFISFEPFFEDIYEDMWFYSKIPLDQFDWFIMGKLTGHGKKYNPKREWIEDFCFFAQDYGIPVFLKNNLKDILGENLIQEFPE